MSKNTETPNEETTKKTTENNENLENNNNNPSLLDQISNNPLEYAYSFWFSKRPGKGSVAAISNPSNSNSNINYDANLRLVGTFNTVEKFWSYYTHMIRPHDLMGHADIHLFKDGIRPMWEDDHNKNGGKWIVRLKKGLANRCWENLILALLGEQFMVGEEICGAVVSVRFQEDLISIWNKTCSNQAVTSRIKDTLKRILNLPPSTILEYKSHNDSLKDNSSFRNTLYVSQ
jgi:translation initiation factor 4E